MTTSMTGFGRAEKTGPTLTATVELASVNRKQADLVLNLPRSLTNLEPALRKILLEKISRGRVNAAITVSAHSTNNAPTLNEARAKTLSEAARRLSELTGQTLALTAADFLADPEIFSKTETPPDPAEAAEIVTTALREALADLLAMRAREGEDLNRDLTARLLAIEMETAAMAARAPEALAAHHRHLHQSLATSGLPINLDDPRLLTELALHAERCDISEELTRLTSHLAQFRAYLAASEPAGRSLDFLCQETNRELNTIGSKARDATLAHHVVTARTELEKIREQVQNVE